MSDIKKIAMIRSSYMPYGGVERLTAELITRILKTGVEISLLTLPHQKWPISHPNLKIIPLGSLIKNRLWQLWRFEQSVCNYLSTNPFDVIFALDRVSFFTHFLGGGGSHKTFLQIKNENSNILVRLFRKMSLFHTYNLHIEKKGFHNPRLQKILCCSNMVFKDISRDYQVDSGKFQIIYFGINWREIGDVFNNRTVIGDELLKIHGLDRSNNWLLFLGSGFDRKGLDIAINGLVFLPESYHLIVIAKDSSRAYIRQSEKLGVKKRVHYLGTQPEGWRYASICKAMILPSRYEPFGLAAAEAQAMGLPVLVSKNTGYAELVKQGKNGIILRNDGGIEEAFTALKNLIEAPTMSPSQIRDEISHLDNDIISEKIIREFLGL
jgi:UDP-glucose:(heptosyl)LPS alpha-1,3-glucosyltransferase